MTLFVLIGVDKPVASELRASARGDHLAYLDRHKAMVKLAGPFLDEAAQPTGSMLIIEAPNLEAAEAFQADDPYVKAQLFQSSDARAWRATIGALG